MANRYKWFSGIVILILVALGTWYYSGIRHTPKPVTGIAEFDSLARHKTYTTVALKPFRYVVVNCDLGPVDVHIVADKKSAIEFHHTFMKYVEVSYKGDTLLVHTIKTPRSTKENPIRKQFYLHTPGIQYYAGEATQTYFSDIATKNLKVHSRSSYIRFIDCEIENLELTTNKSCNFMIDQSCFFNRITAEINPSSAFTCLGGVQTEMLITAKNLGNITISDRNARKFRLRKWNK